ncbi:MAG: hypothetical protein JW839_09260 [Candidatus Lokiarchaeota archaeon]|nr:hypothetical protein [Candidatus Lokiarchaeota archaeon]
MNRHTRPWIMLGTAISIAALLFTPAFIGPSPAGYLPPATGPIDDGMQHAQLEPTASQASGSIDVNMSLQATGTYETYAVTLSRGNMYNFTANSTGSATFDVTLVNDVTVTDYYNQASVVVYSDDMLVSAGVPLWGGYNNWNGITFSSRVTQGASVSSGTSKSFLIYIDDAHQAATIGCNLLVILGSTSDPSDNLATLSWTTVSIAGPCVTINYTDTTTSAAMVFEPDSVNLLKFGTLGGVGLTESLLNETVTTNSSLTLIRWQKDLSGNVRRITTSGIGVTNDVYVPSFRNVKLDGSVLPGFIINPNLGADASLSWSFAPVTDPSVTYSSMPLADTVINFTIAGLNRAFRVVELAGATYFDIELTENILYTQLNWNVAAQFYALGKDNGLLYNLNLRGVNETESATIFATSQNSAYLNSATTFTSSAFSTYRYWFAGHGSASPSITTPTGTQRLGILITATPTTAYLNYSCKVDVDPMPIPTLSSGESVDIGTSLGYPHGSFEMFHVRQFGFEDFAQFKWGIQSSNVTPVSADANLYCNDAGTGAYPRELNNALISNAFSTTSLGGTITLSYEVHGRMQTGDALNIYVKNGTTTALITTESGIITSPTTRTFNITGYSNAQVQIVFNFTSNDMGSGELGPVIDDVRVGNATQSAFLDDFQNDLSKWVQVDNTGGSALYWHIASDSTSFNRPEVEIVYPNQVYSMVGYYAEPAYAGFTREVFGYNPLIQSSQVGYLVIMADGNMVQNFSASVSSTAYHPVNIQDGTAVRSDLEYTQIGITYSLPDFYQYYYLDLEPGYTYGLAVEKDGLDTLIIDGHLTSNAGTNATSTFDRFYGFFVVNLTYYATPESPGRVYFKFATIAPDTTLTIRLTTVSTTPDFPWLLTIMISSIALNALFGFVLAYNRRVLTFPRRRSKMKI